VSQNPPSLSTLACFHCLVNEPRQDRGHRDSTNMRHRADSLASTLDLQTISVKLVTSVQSLRVAINSKLSFTVHVDNVCKSLYFHLRALHHTQHERSRDGVGWGQIQIFALSSHIMPVVFFNFVSVSLPHSGNRLIDHVFLFDFNRL